MYVVIALDYLHSEAKLIHTGSSCLVSSRVVPSPVHGFSPHCRIQFFSTSGRRLPFPPSPSACSCLFRRPPRAQHPARTRRPRRALGVRRRRMHQPHPAQDGRRSRHLPVSGNRHPATPARRDSVRQLGSTRSSSSCTSTVRQRSCSTYIGTRRSASGPLV